MPTTMRPERVASIRAKLDEPDLIPALIRLLAAGEPVHVERLAAAGGWSVKEVQRGLARQSGVEWDEQERIAGFGLTLRPTPHNFTFDGQTVFGWCATDALVFPVLLGRSGVVESTCPATGRRIRVEVTPHTIVSVDPPEAVVSEVRPAERVADVRADVCALGHFFASPEAASDWLAEYPLGFVNPVADDFRIHRQAMVDLGWVRA